MVGAVHAGAFMEQQDATAIANQLVDANLFDITGPIRINYSSTSITGVPLVSYKDADLDLNFQDDEITRIQTAQGELVTVTLDNVVDAFTRTFTLVVPSIRLPRGQEVEFTTLGFETTDRSGAFVPAPGPSGVLQTYQVYQLRAPPSTSSSSRAHPGRPPGRAEELEARRGLGHV